MKKLRIHILYLIFNDIECVLCLKIQHILLLQNPKIVFVLVAVTFNTSYNLLIIK